MSTYVYAKFRCAPLRVKTALEILRELVTRRKTRVAFWDPPSGSKNYPVKQRSKVVAVTCIASPAVPHTGEVMLITTCYDRRKCV